MIDQKRWQRISFYEQIGNIGSELSRAIQFKKRDDQEHMNTSLWRVLELLDLTIDDKRNLSRLRELCRFKEVIGDWFCQTGAYNVDPESLKNYTMDFALLARR